MFRCGEAGSVQARSGMARRCKAVEAGLGEIWRGAISSGGRDEV